MLSLLSGMNWRVVGIAFLLFVTAYGSYKFNDTQWQLKFAKQEHEVTKLQVKVKQLEVDASNITTKVVTKYVDRVKYVEVKGKTIYEKVPFYVTEKSDAGCVIPVGFRLQHDAAASNSNLPESTRTANEEATTIKLSDVSRTVTANYTEYHKVVEQLTALQEWIIQQQKLLNTSIK